ncbi:type IV pilus modification protein PilV [Colwellia piezophila]|uniref:type IV pilus modification protein PilV n=1 Tax=Colwellia piezophila TaxID=211668 RepID=UPI000376D9E1|nr:type IV pilus modification protein PilV [Colwellia piezophila]
MIKNYRLKSSLGFSLVEVLVTTVIVAVGILGILSLQLSQMRSAKQALDNEQASIYLTDMIERIRANSIQSLSYVVAHAVVPGEVDCVSNFCTAIQMAQYDIYTWQKMLIDNLPAGGGEIEQAGGPITITIRWDADLSGSTAKNCPVQTSADLNCLQVII